MAFKEVQSLDADTTISLGGTNRKTNKPNPKQVEGYYLGSKTIDDKKKKSGKSYIHVLQTANGNVGVWGKTDLDRKLLAVEPGTMVRATCTGTRPTPNGDMYTYKVEIDSENTTDVSGIASAPQASNETESYEAAGSSYEEEQAEEQEEVAEEPAPRPAALAQDAAARKAKVAELLKRRQG